jgi:hypothetical protein
VRRYLLWQPQVVCVCWLAAGWQPQVQVWQSQVGPQLQPQPQLLVLVWFGVFMIVSPFSEAHLGAFTQADEARGKTLHLFFKKNRRS